MPRDTHLRNLTMLKQNASVKLLQNFGVVFVKLKNSPKFAKLASFVDFAKIPFATNFIRHILFVDTVPHKINQNFTQFKIFRNTTKRLILLIVVILTKNVDAEVEMLVSI